ncbi:hypothetical protein C9374_002436 [Naegleria lovaniensis]|uniref:Uncharacterized protein n=1 Tax=Naegleria lovaniensis TaxID=51637 RepID=A0AA88GPW0_NAELO|nr:uncharacterized protein C9374_002436 [Naegleria lovaniensis]KAG2386692.1 hypothetical protein C9374_002436 [Naegleria lovaniensis]
MIEQRDSFHLQNVELTMKLKQQEEKTKRKEEEKRRLVEKNMRLAEEIQRLNEEKERMYSRLDDLVSERNQLCLENQKLKQQARNFSPHSELNNVAPEMNLSSISARSDESASSLESLCRNLHALDIQNEDPSFMSETSDGVKQ